jgi:WhiB family redox-sensing transcriptional regulator
VVTTNIAGHSLWARELTPSIVLEAQEWRQDAACLGVDPAVFFPEGASYAPARAICSRCPVLEDCRAWNDKAEGRSVRLFGVYAGESPQERVARRRLFLADAAT